VQDRKYSFTILLGGTSGCGKSTLAALLASRIGFSSVISTDNIRQLMRKFISRAEAPILWASTYHAGEILDEDSSLTHKERILKGYEAQNEMIFKQLDALIGTYEEKKDSLIIEGVHLDTRLIMRLVKRHPTCIPFLMHISNEAKHKERFAIRSKYMTLDPRQNKYTKFFKNIRIINDYLCSGADVKMIPQIDNTNMDRSLATIHATIFNCLRRHVLNGESYYDAKQDNLLVVHEEFEANKHSLWSSKGMLRVIRDKRGKVKKEKKEQLSDIDEEDEEYEEDEETEETEEEDEEESARELVISGQVGDPNFNSDDESEEDLNHKPQGSLLAKPGSTPSADLDDDSDEGDTSDDDDDTKSEYFMDCGSLGS
jgi:2-phosphoglycerate kinase